MSAVIKKGGGVLQLDRPGESKAEQAEPVTPWSERLIAAMLRRQVFQRQVLVVPNCNWTGYECDLLVVTKDLRVIDVEIKISRSDLKADAKKDKWWHRYGSTYDPASQSYVRPSPTAKSHPNRVWKHYYALPADLWDDSLIDCLPSRHSGIILLENSRTILKATVIRRSLAAKDAFRLKPEHAIDVARLASLRMWDAYGQADAARDNAEAWKARALEAGFQWPPTLDGFKR